MRAFFLKTVFAAIITSALLSACGGGGSENSTMTTGATQPSAYLAGVVTAMNDIHSRVPEDFYHLDDATTGDHEYFHVRSNQVWPTATTRYDLATQDPREAANWSAQAVHQQYPLATRLSEEETRWYYESVWYEDDPYSHAHTIHARVFKSSMIDRSVYDANHPTSLLAVLTTTATASDIEWISEYLWTFSTANNSGHVVVSSETTVSCQGYVHTISEAVYEASTEATHVPVQLWNNTYSYNNVDGSLTLRQQYRESFEVEHTDDGYVPCHTASGASGAQQVYPQ